MVRRSFRFGLRLGLLAGIGFAIAKMVQSRRTADSGPSFTAQPAPFPPAPVARTTAATAPAAPAEPATADPTTVGPATAPAQPPTAPAAAKRAAAKKAPAAKKATGSGIWVEPQAGVCPTTHPIKAKLKSKLYHLPGMFAYDRTRPDRCYRDEDAAMADGLTKAKR
jgi:hypothetical protein